MSAPIDVARALHARGHPYEAEVVVLGTLARDPSDTDARSASMALRRGRPLGPPAREPVLDLALVDGWIRRGFLTEALALLAAGLVEGERPPGALTDGDGNRAAEWAALLGELLAPVPAHAEPVFVEMHRQLVRGGAPVAMALLEDRAAEGPLPPWASRRLALLRWMLLDNALAAEDPRASAEAATSPLADALGPALAQRSLTLARDAATRFAAEHPGDGEAANVREALYALVEEMDAQGQMDLASNHTVPIMGRPAAAMQLQMASLKGAAGLYRKLAAGQMAIPEARGLLICVETVLEALEPRTVAQPPMVTARTAEKTFPRPSRDADSGALFDEVTARASDRVRAVAAAPGASRSSPWEDEDLTRVAAEGELPLEAFRESQTRIVRLPEDDTDHYLREEGEIGHREVDAPTTSAALDTERFADTARGGFAEAVSEARAELGFEDSTEASLAPLGGDATMTDLRVDGEEARRLLGLTERAAGVRRVGSVLIAPVLKVGVP